MRESYRLCQRPELLYNVAVLEHELHQCRAALDDYASYLQRVTQGRYRQAAQQASADLNRECPAVAPAAPRPGVAAKAEVVPRAARAKQPDTRVAKGYVSPQHVLAWSAVGAGALAAGGALHFTLAAKSARDDFQKSVDAQFERGVPRDNGLQDRQHRDQTLAQVLAVSGGALIGGGVLFLMFDARGRKPDRANAQVYVQPGLLGACYTQLF